MPARPRVAFYAPLKSPHHPTPSGDRAIARNLMEMLRIAGFDVTLVSELCTRDKHGTVAVQNALMTLAQKEVQYLSTELPRFDLWLTYHNYYKAPDLLGPALSQLRAVPYVQIESTRANKRLDGPWDQFARAAHAAADAADLILSFTKRDQETLIRDRAGAQHLELFAPFLPLTDLPQASSQTGPFLTVAMMRAGDKLASYQLLAEALQQVTGHWQLDIIGDGPARPEVEAAFNPMKDHVSFHGQKSPAEIAAFMAEARGFLWPGINEAFGMVYLEAQAAGVPVVAQDRPGLREILAPAERSAAPAPDDGPAAYGAAIDALNRDGATGRSTACQNYIKQNHLLPAAAKHFKTLITPLLERSP